MFLREFVVLFGFLNGVWIAVGVNPARTLLDVLRGWVERLVSGNAIDLAFAVLPIVLLVATMWLIHRKAGWLGFVAVGCAFLAGVLLLAEPPWSLGFLVVGLALGYWATR